MNVPIPSYPESNLTETNYDLPPPPDNLHDAHSQSTASIEVIFYKLNLKLLVKTNIGFMLGRRKNIYDFSE